VVALIGLPQVAYFCFMVIAMTTFSYKTDFSLPKCLAHLIEENRWVVWKYEKRKGKKTKPPYQSIGGKIGTYAKWPAP